MFVAKVTLLVKITKSVTLKVRASERIENVKVLVKQSEDAVPAHLQELIISGKQLNDGNKLSDYISAGKSAVNVVSRENYITINVKRISNAGIISLGCEVKKSDTIKTVKSMIDAQEGTRSDDYHFVLCGEQLEDDMTVEGSNLKNDSVLYMVLCPRDTLPLQIVMPCGRIERVTVKPLNTIFDVKVALQRNIEMTIDRWHLTYLDEAIEDHVTVAYLGLGVDSLLHVMLPSVQIFVRLQSGKQITIFIKLNDDVASLKKEVCDKAGYPVEYQSLVFSGRVLKEGRRIITYGIQKDSTVHLRISDFLLPSLYV